MIDASTTRNPPTPWTRSSGSTTAIGSLAGPILQAPRVLPCPCPRCGARMIVIEVFASGRQPRWRPTASTIDTS